MNQYLKTIIVEDEVNNAELLKHYIEKHCPMLIVEGVAEDIETAEIIIKNKNPDLVFLDIVLKDDLVFELFDRLETTNFQIIFTTAYDKYALQAFKFNTIDYLLKPISPNELKIAVNKAIINYKANKFTAKGVMGFLEEILKENAKVDTIIAIPSQKEILMVKESEILYCSSQGRYTIINLENGKEIVSSKNLGEYEKRLNSSTFFRIHNSHIINLSFLVKIDKTKDNYCLMTNNALLPLAKRRREKLIEVLNL